MCSQCPRSVLAVSCPLLGSVLPGVVRFHPILQPTQLMPAVVSVVLVLVAARRLLAGHIGKSS